VQENFSLGICKLHNVQLKIATPKAPFPALWKNEISRIAFEKSQIANYHRQITDAFIRYILLQRNALQIFSARKAGWHVSCRDFSRRCFTCSQQTKTKYYE